MKRLCQFLSPLCLALLVACQAPQPTEPLAVSPRAGVPQSISPTLSPAAIPRRVTPLPSSTLTETALPPTIPAPQLTTLAQITTSQPASAASRATPRALTLTVTSSSSPWTFWHVGDAPNSVYSLATQSDQVWAGTQYGIWQIKPGAHHLEKYPMPMGAVSLLLPIENGQLWAGINADLFFFDGQQWQTMTSMNPNVLRGWSTYRALNLLAIDTSGNLRLEAWGSRGDLAPFHYSGHVPGTGTVERDSTNYLYLAQTNCEQLTTLASTHSQSYRSSAECLAFQAALQIVPLPTHGIRLAFAADDSLWGVNLANGEVYHWSNGRLSVIKLPSGSRVNALTADPTHGVWIGTDRGLMYTDGQVIDQLPDLDRHFAGGTPRDLAVESSGNVWALTNDSKLSWLPDDRSVDDFQVVTGVSARSIAAADDGLWITHSTDLIRLKLGERIPHSILLPEADCRLDRLTAAPNGDVWATSHCGAAWQYQPATKRWIRHMFYAGADARSFEPIQAIVAGTDGTVYAIAQSGFAPLTGPGGALTGKLMSGGWALRYSAYWHQALFLADGVAPLPDGPSTADRHGGLWLTANDRGNLWHYTNGQFTAIEHPFGGTWITTLQVDQADRLWVANLYGQLAVYDGQQWRTFLTPGIGTVYRSAAAPDGRLWFAGSQGVARYDPAQDKLP
jgi:hypothetical protein